MKKYWGPLLFFVLLLAACQQPVHKRPVSFYFWKTQFALNRFEQNVLREHAVDTLYVRYFDIDYKPEATQPTPVSPIRLDSSITHYKVVPVIFIKNRTFDRLQAADIPTLAANVLHLIDQINKSQHLTTREIQFDCDWTETTRDHFFQFIREYQSISKQKISSTIRLHQVKYKERMGIPPVDHGVLMYYNIGAINGDNTNSIYERSVANRYNSYIRSYPLSLDVALPVFSWGLQMRNGQVIDLLNKINFTQFENDSNFTILTSNRYQVKHACFKAGYYFQPGDEIKNEHVPADDLLEITTQINKNTNHRIGKLIFYDLDSTNLIQYETDIIKKVLTNAD
ncbi:hypothetical protein A4H97_05160 [Niastella yeongjuensis]|uniref:Lipoprotein n=1 Tax=Niastella yeongjuensis TaxID=354355 RepID=A0A1V9ELG4_9BACT|nr:hypothetical protein [Niastella yeongjuensis]OQP46911.1 hypothetical protein A4H97_05160 [Niastella yeongjuensis]SEN60098.1 hypothetical protein SAMN05660816_01055 [Niastella yeongjuensis]